MYYPHNVDFISFSSYMEGSSNLGIQTALKMAYKGSLSKIEVQDFRNILCRAYVAYMRFGKWDEFWHYPILECYALCSNYVAIFPGYRANSIRLYIGSNY